MKAKLNWNTKNRCKFNFVVKLIKLKKVPIILIFIILMNLKLKLLKFKITVNFKVGKVIHHYV